MMSGGLAKLASTAQSTFTRVQGNIDKVTGRNKILSSSFDEISARIKQTEQTLNSSRIPSQIREARTQLRELQRTRDSMSRQTGGSIGLSGSELMPSMGLKGMVAGALTLGSLYNFGKEVVLTTAKFQGLKNAINTASETAKQGEISFLWIKSFSNKYGLEVEAVADGFKTLQGAMMKTKFTSSDTRKMFEQVSTGVVALGLSSDDAKGTFLALGQMMGKGKVQAEELRGQIGERIPGAFAIAARAMNMSTSELDKFMQDGKLVAEDFLPKFAAEMEKTFGSKAAENAHGLTQEMNRMSSAWTNLMTSIGESDSNGLMGKTFAGISKGLDWISNTYFKSISQKQREVGTLRSAVYLEQLETRTKNLGGVSVKDKSQRIESFREKEIQSLTRVYDAYSKDVAKIQSKILADLGFKGKFSFEDAQDKIDYFKDRVSPATFKKYNESRIQQENIRSMIKGASQFLDTKLSGLFTNKKENNTTTTSNESVAKDITSGGPRVININGVKFAEKIEFHVANMAEGAEQALTTFEDMFLRVLNSGAIIQ